MELADLTAARRLEIALILPHLNCIYALISYQEAGLPSGAGNRRVRFRFHS